MHTLRAVENFPITRHSRLHLPDLVSALAAIKQAAALANRDLGLLDAERADAIVAACRGDPRAAPCTTSSWST